MTPPLPTPWDGFVRVGDPNLGQTVTLLHPALTITFTLRWIGYAAVRQLYDAAMLLMQPELTHYQAENMKRPAKITPRALSMIPAWMQKPKEDHVYWWQAYSGADLGCAPPGLEFWLWATPLLPPEKKLRRVQGALLHYGGAGDISHYVLSSSIRLLLPVDHPLGEASALLAWLQALDLLKLGNFDSITCSYGLSILENLDFSVDRYEQALCSRYPGLDSFRFAHSGQVRVDASYPDLIPLVKRAAWTTVLQELTVRALGGEAKVREQLADTPEIRVTSFAQALILQAGERPELGDLNRGDTLPLLRKVAAVIRPVRTTKILEQEARGEFWEHFFNIFEKDYG